MFESYVLSLNTKSSNQFIDLKLASTKFAGIRIKKSNSLTNIVGGKWLKQSVRVK